MTTKRTFLLLPLLMLLVVGDPAAAQTTTRSEKANIERELLGELGKFALNFWIPRLNGYRVRIDRSLPTSDVVELDALRIRWSMLIEQELDKSESRSRRYSEREPSVETIETTEPTNVDIAVATSEPMYTDEVANGPGISSEAEIAVAVAPVPEPMEIGVGGTDRGVSNEGSPRKLSHEGVTATAGVGGDLSEPQMTAPEREKEPVMVLVESAQAIALDNRTQMDAIHDLIITDLNAFLDQAIVMVDRFFEQNRGRVREDDLENWSEFKESMASVDAREKLIAEFDKLYTSGGESFVMLYNGTDILRLLGVALPSSTPLSDLNIPTTSMLGQNVPNPAMSSTIISYKLQEPSTRTSLDIFDASGSTMMTLDLGARATGEHSAVVDVSKLIAGSYLYRLTVQTAQGEQVSSKVMQVIR